MSFISRREVVVGLPLLVGSTGALARDTQPDFAAIERRCGGRLGVVAIDTGSGRSVRWRAENRFPFCSSMKLLLAAYVLWKVDRGAMNLDRIVSYGAADLLPYAPITRPAVVQGGLSVAALCRAAVSYSDNTAANLLLRAIGGPRAMTAWMRSQGDAAFDLSANEPGLNLSRFGDRTNTTTPQAMAESVRRFVVGGGLRPASRARLAGWLVANTTGDRRLRAGLPRSWRVGDKTGTYGGRWFSTIDVAVAWPRGRAPIVITGFVTDGRDTASDERALAEVARQVALWAGGSPAA